MPGRDVLVVIDNAATAAHLLAPAAVLARRFDARLTGFFRPACRPRRASAIWRAARSWSRPL
jgi:hypothetical protein